MVGAVGRVDGDVELPEEQRDMTPPRREAAPTTTCLL
jgi:hypothetical protein